jgi:hypothetical protein
MPRAGPVRSFTTSGERSQPTVARYYGANHLRSDIRVVFVIAPVNVSPANTMSRLKDFVRRGGSLIVMDDSRIGERGSAKDFLKQFDVSITSHGAGAGHGAEKPHVHIAGMDLIRTPSAETFATRKVYEQGQLVYLWDAKDYSRSAASIDRGRRLMRALIQRCSRVPSDSVDDDATATSVFKRLVVLRARPWMWKSAIAGDHTQVSVNVSPQNVLDLVIAGLRSVSAVVIYWRGASKPRRERLMSGFRSRFLLRERLVPFRLGSSYAETDAALLSRTIVGY